jgi:hypothetical protein
VLEEAAIVGDWDLLDWRGLHVVYVCADAMVPYSNAAALIRSDLENMAPNAMLGIKNERERAPSLLVVDDNVLSQYLMKNKIRGSAKGCGRVNQPRVFIYGGGL